VDKPPLGPATVLVLAAYIEIAGDVDTRDRITFADQADALLRAGWDSTEVARLARRFAKLGVEPQGFARWAQKRR